ncbi:SusD/RagB family nutrient-binding outer membrane lipoprotein [Ulvibacter antarcticus]|uniref:SusD-like starch-binding protein associating with outer membrane n=1 Tax=Ulvibacter antarcticus TaxID=442714 RepID=A0A3L9YRL2_9FLAO|nr:SusD/RagB family nutrient-binding outer membrane lipoprotein [Ulvibacter antarcticus]RMA57102.1 hypothetical protein BXY75_2983 [Ulvibacter antarcticus]
MKNIYKIFYLFSTCALLVACDGLVQQENFQDDPNTVGLVPTVNLIAQTELVAMYLTESDASRYAGINSNYIVGAQAQWEGYEQYVFTPSDFNTLWFNIYVEGMTQARTVKIQAEAELDDDAIATASFFEAFFLGELAASFGNVPDSEAIVPGIVSPVYDGQIAVLNHVQELLDVAISRGNGSTLYINDTAGGTKSTSTLGRLAHSMKARYFLIMKDYGNALIHAQAGINAEGGDLYGTHSTANGAQNLWYNFTATARPGNIAAQGSYLQELVDPAGSVNRRLATPGEAQRYDFYYRGNGSFNNREGGIFAIDASLPIIGWHETMLILAEAAQRENQDGLARNSLNAVRAALAAQYSGDFPASTASGNDLLLHILEEKYISIYPSPQTWHDLNRTNNALGVTPKTGTQLPQRFLYPQNELDTNTNAPSPIPGIFVATAVNQ